ncbi:MAG: nitroreductase family deazaflavin-dependent oxidoreductase [Acidimicrobiia bacterium]
MSEREDRNQRIIDEFRANGGVVGGPFEGMTILLLHHEGARTGTKRVNPLAYREEDGRLFVFASMGGAPTNPDWYHNLRAHPEVEVEVGTDRFPAVATVLEGDERDRIWAHQKADRPQFADYEARTERVIPVIALDRA